MSVIAWDGSVLAADKQGTYNAMRLECTKVYQVGDAVVAFCGELDKGMVLLDWYRQGALREKWPVFKDDRLCRLVVFSEGRLVQYESQPVPIPVEQVPVAFGAGAELAMGAMGFGATAVQAVEVTCTYSVDCGLGVDSFPAVAAP